MKKKNLDTQMSLRISRTELTALTRTAELFNVSLNDLIRFVFAHVTALTKNAVEDLTAGKIIVLTALKNLTEENIISQVASDSAGSSPAGLELLLSENQS